MNAHTPAHAVHYFAWVNLKGAVISICVGIVVYFLFIRKVLMQKDTGSRDCADVGGICLTEKSRKIRKEDKNRR